MLHGSTELAARQFACGARDNLAISLGANCTASLGAHHCMPSPRRVHIKPRLTPRAQHARIAEIVRVSCDCARITRPPSAPGLRDASSRPEMANMHVNVKRGCLRLETSETSTRAKPAGDTGAIPLDRLITAVGMHGWRALPHVALA
jgi:hypothetical protein